jgi:hypothetical protein
LLSLYNPYITLKIKEETTMEQKYLSPEVEIILLKDEVFLQTSKEVDESADNLFDWGW